MSEVLIRKIESERDALVRQYDAALNALRGEKGAAISEVNSRLIREIEAVRDDVVRRYTASLEALRGVGEPTAHRFNPRVAPRPQERAKRPPNGTPQPKPAPNVKRKRPAAAEPDNPEGTPKMPSFRQIVRDAVRAQTTAFSKKDIIAYVEHIYPQLKQLPKKGSRYSNELLHMRKVEKRMDLDGKSEKGAENNYLPRAA